MVDKRLFGSLEFRCIGPHRGGRVVAVAGHPTERGTFYFGGCAGGVWKTTNGGSHWENISDGFFNTAAVGALAVSDSDPNVIYVGTGETSIRSNVSHGDGVYKSTDGGATWRNVGLKDTRHIGAIRIHPKNPNIVYVAALGHAWGDNSERGVFRTVDGGRNWQKVLYKSDNAGAVDLSWDPGNPNIIYAAIWQGRRYPHACVSGGENSGLWVSHDGGDHWTDITRNAGLPQTGLIGKIGVAASPAKPGRVWALVEHESEGPLYRSEDYGATWKQVSDNKDLKRRPWYYMHIFADPSDADTMWVLNLNTWKSVDAGKSVEQVPTPHGDNHGLWIDPRDSNRMIQGNDGGANISFDGGQTWSSILNQPTAQFYHVVADDATPYNVYGSQQDNWAMRLPMISFEGAISWKDYVEPGGGESGHIAISRKPPHKVYGGGIGTGAGHGRLICWDPRTRQTRNITVWPEVHGMGAGAGDLKYRFQWTFPTETSPHDVDAIYICSNHVHVTRDDGTTWEIISPDLTRNDPERLKPSGGPITYDNSGAEIYCTIFAFRESPHEAGVFWAGSDCGLVHISRDGGKSWTNITPAGLPEWAQIMHIEPSAHDKATAYMCATCYKLDDTRPYLYKTTDYGQTWTKIVGGIPDQEFTRIVRADPVKPGLLLAGTETGIYVSFDDGGAWHRVASNLPVVPIHDFVIKNDDLVVATHGRSFWILDDMTPLRQMSGATAEAAAHLFQPRPTTRWRHYGRAFGAADTSRMQYKMTGPVTVSYKARTLPTGQKDEMLIDAGKNPPNGVVAHYWLREAPKEGETVTLTFRDKAGNAIRTITSDAADPPKAPAAAGANRFVWDMRGEPPVKEDNPKAGDIFAAMLGNVVAPKAPPGEYSVELKVGASTQSQSFTITHDPRLDTTDADLAAQYDLKVKIREQMNIAHGALNQLRKTRGQVDGWAERVKGSDHEATVGAAAKELSEQLSAIEARLTNVTGDKTRPGMSQTKDKLGTLSSMIDESDDKPTQGAYDVFAMLTEQNAAARRDLDALIANNVPAFNQKVLGAGIAPVGA